MLEEEFERLYLKFRTIYFRKLFDEIKEKTSDLTASEALSVEVIYLLNHPTVREFADFLNISQPNATYKVNSLLKNGYIKKSVSLEDKREYHLEVTDKFLGYYGLNDSYIGEVMKKIREKFSKDEVHLLESMIARIVDDIMD